MSQHTTGPWKVAGGGKYVEAETCSIAKVYFLPELMDDAAVESQANARLIAAAPEMKALLRVLVDACEYPEHDDARLEYLTVHVQREDFYAVRALLARIEGA